MATQFKRDPGFGILFNVGKTKASKTYLWRGGVKLHSGKEIVLEGHFDNEQQQYHLNVKEADGWKLLGECVFKSLKRVASRDINIDGIGTLRFSPYVTKTTGKRCVLVRVLGGNTAVVC